MSLSYSPTKAEVEAAAREIDPRAFREDNPAPGCGGPWHDEGHSSHSTCPTCGSKAASSPAYRLKQRGEARQRAKVLARRVLRAAAKAWAEEAA